MNTVFIGTDNLVQIDELENESSGSYINDATATMTLYDSDFTAVTDAEGLALSYVSGSNGKYEGTLPDTLVLTPGDIYFLDITVTASGTVLLIRMACRAEYAKGVKS